METFSLLEVFKAVILGIVQGITEWLPVSSTGHMILVDEFIKLNFSSTFINTFLVVIQFGSILAVLVIFFRKLNPFDSAKNTKQKKETVRLWLKVIIAVIPSGVIGILFEDDIDRLFFNSTVVAIALIVYGIIMIGLENRNKRPKYKDFSQVTYKLALCIGLFQCLALIPGTSRSGSTIIGAVLLGTSRYVAAEFSFFLAIPTMLGASALKLLKAGFGFTGFEWLILGVGSVVAFIVSIVVIKFFMDYIKKHDFKVFGYYRIILGIVVLGYFFLF
ncbi:MULTISPECIES: undecaprenyl-diphosphate phosphatase [unclassified Clostridioides]|uniref:undecaprenyl-diphosphate phosphatase n=1 Tax=unclassified Clostridioides TaxID=2635829 RepID=UPI001D0C2CDE|nr:undecaprenyl-diphosphate phosphatase [Clostridioides sp. ES-S-0001-02]MCC0640391.1 undecaprenyl-diphosphate phosphatase [Clostridioides sp. ES-S-0049-03]MCC0651828.1 undecaprenyl-diphosphate phosphatase [Clostridioides sp. ES-S-0001-03]MCC0657628.1 undecaprenyl-diphosphate phosphatase [Clostridioides sp. ES-S-0123-01]MCC0671098.1 undecaprenyl-diphosphate phosphatase [Clostridioides sp. ES-S-0145-01]MCC0676940.1 undecaprenyl-diphosphate phosphatase [Clostridioides sp. ES-W-0018-02]MCC067890